jgi:hypothetical protein
MKILLIATLIVLVIVLISCSNQNSKTSGMTTGELGIKPLIIEKYDDGGLGGDLKLSIIESTQSEKKYYKVNSSLKYKTINA